MELKVLVQSSQALKSLANTDLAARSALRLALMLKQADVAITAFEESRTALFKKYGEAVEGGAEGAMNVKEENVAAFTEEYDALLAEEIVLDVKQIPIDDITGVLKASDLITLDWLFEAI